MKEQIQNLISDGNLEGALELLAQYAGNDAVLLQARYNQAKKQQNMGMIDFGEWSRVQAQINYAALDLAGKIKVDKGHSNGSTTSGNTSAQGQQPSGIKTFISYNHKDAEIAIQVKGFLEAHGIEVILDRDDMSAGRSIMEFIQESIKKADAVVSIVSKNSLQSGWVAQESLASLYAIWLADKKFIPVSLDTVAFDSKFQIEALTGLKTKIEGIDADIATIRDLGSDARDLEDDRRRLIDLRNDFSKILQRLKSVLMLDISGDNFTPNMGKVLKTIQA